MGSSQWHKDWYDTESSDDKFVRQDVRYRIVITPRRQRR